MYTVHTVYTVHIALQQYTAAAFFAAAVPAAASAVIAAVVALVMSVLTWLFGTCS